MKNTSNNAATKSREQNAFGKIQSNVIYNDLYLSTYNDGDLYRAIASEADAAHAAGLYTVDDIADRIGGLTLVAIRRMKCTRDEFNALSADEAREVLALLRYVLALRAMRERIHKYTTNLRRELFAIAEAAAAAGYQIAMCNTGDGFADSFIAIASGDGEYVCRITLDYFGVASIGSIYTPDRHTGSGAAYLSDVDTDSIVHIISNTDEFRRAARCRFSRPEIRHGWCFATFADVLAGKNGVCFKYVAL